MPLVLESEAEDQDGDGHHGGGEPDDDEAGFGLDVARVPAHVVVTDKIVEPVTENSADDGAGNGGEVEETWNRNKASLLAYGIGESDGRDVPRLYGVNL